LFGRGITAEDASVILVDTSVIVAWLDGDHDHHESGTRTREHVDEQLAIFRRVPLDAESAWRAGVVFRQYRRAKGEQEPVLPERAPLPTSFKSED
jgi:hypothetical protein